MSFSVSTPSSHRARRSAEYAGRFEARLALEPPHFHQVVSAFRVPSSQSGAMPFFGGTPPPDQYMVSSAYICPSGSLRPDLPTDYGNCDYGQMHVLPDGHLAERRGPPTLADTKLYIPCAQINCTKVAADGMACAHRVKHAGKAGRRRRARGRGAHDGRGAAPHAAARDVAAQLQLEQLRLQRARTDGATLAPVTSQCRLESSPDGLM
eukprot:3322697-Prymnesium_polylepis.2